MAMIGSLSPSHCISVFLLKETSLLDQLGAPTQLPSFWRRLHYWTSWEPHHHCLSAVLLGETSLLDQLGSPLLPLCLHFEGDFIIEPAGPTLSLCLLLRKTSLLKQLGPLTHCLSALLLRETSLSWNVNGIGEKRQDTDFIEINSQYNMVCFTEMWSSVKTNVKIKGLEKPFHLFRHKCRKKGCRSGGILVYLKKQIAQRVKGILKTHDDLL